MRVRDPRKWLVYLAQHSDPDVEKNCLVIARPLPALWCLTQLSQGSPADNLYQAQTLRSFDLI